MASAQTALPRDPVAAIVQLFETYRIVILGEIHDSRQQNELLHRLVEVPGFAGRVNDIVVEACSARFQGALDAYISGAQEVSLNVLKRAWQNNVAPAGPVVDPPYGNLFARLRSVNAGLPAANKIRVLCGDPPIDWARVESLEDIALFLPFRDSHYACLVRTEVLAKRRRALLIVREEQCRRLNGKPGVIEQELLTALVKPYVIVPGSNMVDGYDHLDPRFDQWPAPWMSEIQGTWMTELPGWTAAADAYLYLGPRDKLTRAPGLRRADLAGTPYGKEMERRMSIFFGQAPNIVPEADVPERPLFEETAEPLPPLLKPPSPKP